uniref:RYYR-CCHC domain-containing protein n=1 Tax=Parascaris univalens TaxID=6257 RepID=A0A915ACK5_PARUN
MIDEEYEPSLKRPKETEADYNDGVLQPVVRRVEQRAMMERLYKSEIWSDLVRQYDERSIPTLKELRKRILETTGIDISYPTLSRHLNSGGKGKERRMRARSAPSSASAIKEEILVSAPSVVKYRSLSRKLRNTLLTIGEQGGVRQYQRLGMSTDGSKEYFRCGSCYRCKRKKGDGVVAHLTMREGRIISDAHPRHHEDCRPISEESAAIQALDRQSRKDVRIGKKLPKDAHAVGFERALELANNSGGPPSRKFSMPAMYPAWNRVRRAYYRARRKALHQVQKPDGQDLSDAECDASRSEVFIEETLAAESGTATDSTTEFIDPVSLSASLPISRVTSAESPEIDSNIAVDEVLASTTSGESRSSSSVHDGAISSCTSAKNFDMPSVLSPSDSTLKQSISTSPVRRRWLMRDVRTGRIVVRECVSSRFVPKIVVPHRKTPLPNPHASTESVHDHGVVKMSGDYMRNDLKRQEIVPHHSDGEDSVSNPLQLPTAEHSGTVMGNHPSRTHRTAKIAQMEDGANKEVLINESDKGSKDEYDKIGESLADCLRKVCEKNLGVGVKFKCDLLQMMAKYEMMSMVV